MQKSCSKIFTFPLDFCLKTFQTDNCLKTSKQTGAMMKSQDDTCIVMKGGRKFRRLPMHVSMHVENEASVETVLR